MMRHWFLEKKSVLKTTSEFSSGRDFPTQSTSAFSGPITSETWGKGTLDSGISAVASTLSVVLTMWD